LDEIDLILDNQTWLIIPTLMQIWSAEIKELESIYTSIKGRFPELEKELERLVKADDENMVLLYSRRCLEVIISDLCINELKRPRKTEPLKGIIDKLSHEEKVPSNIIASMEGLNSLSTFGAHPKDFDPEQVRPILLNLATIIKWYVKYKDIQIISKAKPEEAKYESKEPVDIKDGIQKPKKRLILLLSGLALVVIIVVVALLVFGILGGGEQTEEMEKSIAVLPFDNLSNDEDQTWFSDGITDVIISQLSKISGLRVIGRTSTLKYKEKEEKKSIAEIGKELNVNYIIEGTVQKQEDKMRISVQLIRAVNESHIWSDIYDREWKDIFDVQSGIAQRIAKALKTMLSPEERENIEKYNTQNPEAYNLYLKGRFFWSQRTKEGLNKSVEYFNKAIEIDPDYALAYAGLADAYNIQAWWGWLPVEEGFAKAKQMALKALEMDNNLSEAHAVLGSLYHYKEWKWEEALKELELAVELDPNYVTAHHYYSEVLFITGQRIEARKQINIAMELDPFFPILRSVSIGFYYCEGEFKNAIDECNVLQELDPEFGNGACYWDKFYVYIRQEEDIKALAELLKALQMDSSTAKVANHAKEVYNQSGKTGLLSWLIEMELQAPRPNSLPLAKWYAMLDQRKEAINWLEKAFDEKLPQVVSISFNPDFNNLRSEPRFIELIKKMGLSEYAIRE
jgi:TolB-like protein/Tfp pilus assembly protein PilF